MVMGLSKDVLMIIDKEVVEKVVLADVVEVVETRGRNIITLERRGIYNECAGLPEVVPTGLKEPTAQTKIISLALMI